MYSGESAVPTSCVLRPSDAPWASNDILDRNWPISQLDVQSNESTIYTIHHFISTSTELVSIPAVNSRRAAL